ncbi:MAG: hypothetical protein IKP00_11785 [Victivallales bacterium]|nr:hypothetical protein [Victivallales bacterium]
MKILPLFGLLFVLGVYAQEVNHDSPVPPTVQEEATVPKSDNAQSLQKTILNAVLEQNPGMNGDELLDFCNEYTPDLLDEWKRLCAEQPEKAQNYLELLTKRFLKALSLREKDTSEYERFVNQLKNETQIRTLSRRIQLLDIEDENTLDERRQLKIQLVALMEKAFDEAQLQQQIEINRLENEVRNLRNLAEERAANKQFILRQRFLLLTGEEWP